jgi:hypothetical protein
MQVNIVFFVIMFYYDNKDVKKNMEVMIRITTPRVFFDACPTDKLKSMRLKLKQGEIKWK